MTAIIWIFLFVMVTVLTVVGVIIGQISICKNKEGKRFVIPIVCLFFTGFFISCTVGAGSAAYRNMSIASVAKEEEISRDAELFDKIIAEYEQATGIYFNEQPWWNEVETVKAVFGSDNEIMNIECYDKDGVSIFTYASEDVQDGTESSLSPAFYVVVPALLIFTFGSGVLCLITFIMALVVGKRKVSESQEIDIMNL